MNYDYTFTYNRIEFGIIDGRKGLLIVKTCELENLGNLNENWQSSVLR